MAQSGGDWKGPDRMITPLTVEKARQLLSSKHLARLACVVNGYPYVIPINYKFENEFIYCHSLPGTKIEGLRQHPRACVQVDEIKSDLYWKSVLVFGHYEEVVDPAQRELILDSLLREFPMLTPVESALGEGVTAQDIIVFRIRIDRITGVSEGTGSDEFLLEDAADGSYSAG
jgi:nitroimidazol reductase NimA-like FMN-containing flavoprotein (pyridoxamine 5'-phosphate oxidase superfamily)